MAHQMAPFSMTLSDLHMSFHLLQTFSNASSLTTAQQPIIAVANGLAVSQTIVINGRTAQNHRDNIDF